MVCHEHYYFRLDPIDRKKFTLKLKANSLLEEYAADDLSSITCQGFTIDKLTNMVKKENMMLFRLGNFGRELVLLEKYLRLSGVVNVMETRPHMKRWSQAFLKNLGRPTATIRLNQAYLSQLSSPQYKGVLYLIEDVHLGEERGWSLNLAQQHFLCSRSPLLDGL